MMASQAELWCGDLALEQDAVFIKEAFIEAGHFVRSVRVHNKENRDVCFLVAEKALCVWFICVGCRPHLTLHYPRLMKSWDVSFVVPSYTYSSHSFCVDLSVAGGLVVQN